MSRRSGGLGAIAAGLLIILVGIYASFTTTPPCPAGVVHSAGGGCPASPYAFPIYLVGLFVTSFGVAFFLANRRGTNGQTKQ